jgi:ABC-type siderophore export system fused ATPase/permease subunit
MLSRHSSILGFFSMNAIFFEQPWIVGAIGTVITIVTLYGWTQTGNSIALKTAVVFAVATLLLMIANLFIETDAEQVRTWLSSTAADLQNNDFDKVLKKLSPDCSERVTNVAERMKNVKFSIAKVTKIHAIEVETDKGEVTAGVRMNAFVVGESNGISANVPRWVRLTLEKKNRDWLIIDFEDKDPQHEFMNSSDLTDAISKSRQGGP